MATRIHTAHDLFLKATLSSPQAVQDFFQAYLPDYLRPDTDFSSIRPIRESHILSSFKKLENDLLFTCQIGGMLALLLVEHQSGADWRMLSRFLSYLAAANDEYTKNKPVGTPWLLFINFCIYHGELNKPYPYPTNSYDCIPNARLAQAMDAFVRFTLINLSTSLDFILEGHGTIGLLEKLFKYRNEKNIFHILGDELERCRDWILGINMPVAPLGVDYWKFILTYMTNVLDKERFSEQDLISLFEAKLFINKEDIMRTIAQEIEKRGEVRGRQAGLELGRQEEKAEIARAMFMKGLTVDFIQEVTHLPQQAIAQLIRPY